MRGQWKRMCVLVAIVAASMVQGVEALENTEANRKAQAERYLEAAPPEEMIAEMASNMAKSVPEERRAEFIEVMTKHLDMTSLRKTMVEAMVKHFTAEELKALADFYGSAIGKSAMKKFGNYMGEIGPKFQQDVMRAFSQFMISQEEK